MFDELPDVVKTLATAVVSAVIALIVVQIVQVVIRRIGRRAPLFDQIGARLYRPAQTLAVVLALQGSLHATTSGGSWRNPLLHAISILIIASSAWVVGALLLVLEDAALSRFRTDVENNKTARRVHTQIMVVRRVTVAVVVVIAVGAMLVTFPTARAAGTSLLASAGIAGVVAALAAQSVLGNVFAGVQLAFSDELRLDDVVVVENEWGRVEDITLSYVVLHLWDDRRLTLPTSYFTTKPFQNWTRNESALLGAVEIDVDWAVPTEEMRRELRHICEGTDLWDGRACVFQVTDATGGLIRVRALVTARDAPTAFDLQCHVRERLVQWLRENYPQALPRTRSDVTGIPGLRIDKVEGLNGYSYPLPDGEGRSDGDVPDGRVGAGVAGRAVAQGNVPDSPRDARVFSGSADGRERSAAFTGRSDETER